MDKLTNNMIELSQLNKNIYQKLKIDKFANNKNIIKNIEPQLENIFNQCDLNDDTFFNIITDLIDDPNNTIEALSEKYRFPIKNLD